MRSSLISTPPIGRNSMALRQIGEVLAKRIVEDRKQHGPFRSHDDLDRVYGIGRKTIDNIRPHLLPIAEEETIPAADGRR